MNFLEKQNFDFLYDGKRIDECPHQLTITTHEDTVTKEFLFHDGLKVINITKRYAAFDAYEWATWFENTSDHPTNVISNIKDCCCNFEFPSDQQYDWHSTYQPDFHKALKVFNPIGSYCNEKDFQMPMDANESGRCFNHLYNHDTFNYKPAGGRSSDGLGYHLDAFEFLQKAVPRSLISIVNNEVLFLQLAGVANGTVAFREMMNMCMLKLELKTYVPPFFPEKKSAPRHLYA